MSAKFKLSVTLNFTGFIGLGVIGQFQRSDFFAVLIGPFAIVMSF